MVHLLRLLYLTVLISAVAMWAVPSRWSWLLLLLLLLVRVCRLVLLSRGMRRHLELRRRWRVRIHRALLHGACATLLRRHRACKTIVAMSCRL